MLKVSTPCDAQKDSENFGQDCTVRYPAANNT